MPSRILVVDDEKLIRWSLRERLQADGHQVTEAPDAATARKLLQEQPFDLALLDMKLPDGTGLELLQLARQEQPTLTALIITAHSSVDTAVEAMKEGAYDYISKPFSMDEIAFTIQRALEAQALRHTLNTEIKKQKQRFGIASLVGESAAFNTIKNMVARVAASETTTVLLLGETGCGKDMIARAIHYESARVEKPFMNITCTAMPETLIESELFGYEAGAFTNAKGRKEGLFELGNHGTVFLDEIGDMPPNLQAKLLRVLEEKAFRRIGGTTDIQVNCRIIAATNRDLPVMMEEGSFREDLYYRLSTVPILIPPLRERNGDITLLARNFLTSFSREMGRSFESFTAQALDKLNAYTWPGNVRELRNVIERAVLLSAGPTIDHGDIMLGRLEKNRTTPEETFTLPDTGCILADVEQSLIRQALQRTQGNQSQAARLLGLSRDQIRYKLSKQP